jgi:hypothetical protein
MTIPYARIIAQDSKGGSIMKGLRGDVTPGEMDIFETEEKEPKKTREGAQIVYRELSSLADKVEAWVQSGELIDINEVTPVLRFIIEKGLIDEGYTYLTFEGDGAGVLPSRAMRVALLSLKMGVGMGYDDERLAELGTAAFLHDVGRYKMPEDVLNKGGSPSDQRHPQISADILSGSDDNYGWLATVVLQVHERADGSGYPFGLKREEIHEYAFIIGLADMYADMISNGRGGQVAELNRAVRDIMDSAKEAFPAEVIRAFVHQVSFFPLGSYVKLNDRSIGRVVSTNPDYPLRPTVEMLNDGIGGTVGNTRVVDLSQQVLLYITGSVDETENP